LLLLKCNYFFTAYGIRIGATNYLATLNGIELHHIVLRGGWSFEDICKVFEYLVQLSATVAIAGRALAHAPNYFKGAYPPKMIQSNPTTKAFFDNFVGELLVSRVPARFMTCSLRIFLDVVGAELIMHHSKMLSDVGDKDPIVKLVTDTVKRLNFPLHKFRSLGKSIEEEWIKKNEENKPVETTNNGRVDSNLSAVHPELETLIAAFESRLDQKLIETIDDITDTLIEKLKLSNNVHPMNTSIQNLPVTTATIDGITSNKIIQPVSMIVGDRGDIIPIKSLKKLGLAALVERYYKEYMDQYAVGTWKVVVPDSGNRSRILMVVNYVSANLTLEHSSFISSRPPISSDSDNDTLLSWRRELPKKAQDIEKHVVSCINNAAVSKSYDVNKAVEGISGKISVGSIYKALNRIASD
jgi:hypothetical protein